LETPRRRWITVTSSLNKVSSYQLGNRVGRRYSGCPRPLNIRLLDYI
jgi:hypothetical protein